MKKQNVDRVYGGCRSVPPPQTNYSMRGIKTL